MPTRSLQRACDAVWRSASTRIVGVATRIVHDAGLAGELTQNAPERPQLLERAHALTR